MPLFRLSRPLPDCPTMNIRSAHRGRKALPALLGGGLLLSVLLVAGCGGAKSAGAQERSVHGTGYVFSAPTAWQVTRSGREISVSSGLSVVSVTRFLLQRAFRPALWPKVVRELDRAAAAVAQQQAGTIAESRTVAIAGGRARQYEVAYAHDGKQLVERLVFVLREKTEYLLLCRYERGGDTRACDRLLATFRLT